MKEKRLELVGITKRYPAVVANSDVSLVVAAGELTETGLPFQRISPSSGTTAP